MIFQTRYLDRNSDIVWTTPINALSAEEAVATTVFFDWAPGSQSVQIVDELGNEVYLISKNIDSAKSQINPERCAFAASTPTYAYST